MLCGSRTTSCSHSVWNFLNHKWRLLLTCCLSLVTGDPTIIWNLIRTWLFEREESTCLWGRRSSIFLDNFNLMSRNNHLLSSRNDLLLLGLSRVVVCLLCDSNPNLLFSVSTVTCLWNWLRRLLLWSFARNECNVLQLDPLHNSSGRFSLMSSTSCSLAITIRPRQLSLWRLASTCIVELNYFLRYNLTLVVTNHRWLIVRRILYFSLGWVADLLNIIGEYSLLISDDCTCCVCLCRFNLISVWGGHCDVSSSNWSLYFV